jgi:hypothetical protein
VNEQEQERYEAELRRAAPARLPERLVARLQAAKPVPAPARPALLNPAVARMPGRGVWRWLAPGLAVALAVLLVSRADFNRGASAGKKPLVAAYRFNADDVQVDHDLVSSFEVVATLPGGEPVRFHCRKWQDQFVVIDTHRGVEIEQSAPRIEVVPVRFETY